MTLRNKQKGIHRKERTRKDLENERSRDVQHFFGVQHKRIHIKHALTKSQPNRTDKS